MTQFPPDSPGKSEDLIQVGGGCLFAFHKTWIESFKEH